MTNSIFKDKFIYDAGTRNIINIEHDSKATHLVWQTINGMTLQALAVTAEVVEMFRKVKDISFVQESCQNHYGNEEAGIKLITEIYTLKDNEEILEIKQVVKNKHKTVKEFTILLSKLSWPIFMYGLDQEYANMFNSLIKDRDDRALEQEKLNEYKGVDIKVDGEEWAKLEKALFDWNQANKIDLYQLEAGRELMERYKQRQGIYLEIYKGLKFKEDNGTITEQEKLEMAMVKGAFETKQKTIIELFKKEKELKN